MKRIILGIYPLSVNGGITSWAKRLLQDFPNEEFSFITIDNSPKERKGSMSFPKRIYTGLAVLPRIVRELNNTLCTHDISIVHATTSGGLGTLRDYLIGRICKKNRVKSILHCHYGCISEDLEKNCFRRLFIETLSLYEQIWVLDRNSFQALKKISRIKDKIRLTPNPILVECKKDMTPKSYHRVAFIGNLIPTKGIFEVVKACLALDVRLDIVGPGSENVINSIKDIAKDKINNSIYIHGRLPNSEAVKFMKDIDILCLPTYYPLEAFPISILEAMSLSKLVISCPKAAIPDMLETQDGDKAGILVPPKSSADIRNAIKWCQDNPDKADIICENAYDKAISAYNQPIVYKIYRDNYRQLL